MANYLLMMAGAVRNEHLNFVNVLCRVSEDDHTFFINFENLK